MIGCSEHNAGGGEQRVTKSERSHFEDVSTWSERLMLDEAVGVGCGRNENICRLLCACCSRVCIVIHRPETSDKIALIQKCQSVAW